MVDRREHVPCVQPHAAPALPRCRGRAERGRHSRHRARRPPHPNHAILPDALPPPWEKNPVKHYQRGVGCDGRGEVACLFTNTSGASARATASVVDWNHARCRTPPMAAGLRSVRLTYDDGYSRTPAAAYAFAVYDDYV